jgi:nucleoside-diphosphate-sugar epimerase
MNILITGSTGFVGVNAAKTLAKKHKVFALIRSVNKAEPLLDNKHISIIRGDILDFNSLKSAMDGVDAVLHIAGLIKSHNVDNLYLINKQGSLNVAEAAKAANIENIVYISSLAARGPSEINQPVSHYGYSKRYGEYEFIKRFAQKNLKILRPPVIYGPYEKEFFTLFKMAKLGIFPVLKDRRCSFVHIEDLVWAIDRLIELKVDGVKIYHISDGKSYSWDEVANYIFNAVGRKSGFKLNMNYKRAKLIAYLTYFLKDKAPFTFDKINEIKALSWSCGYEDLSHDIGFSPKYTIEKGFKQTYEWYVGNGWI